MGISFQSKEEEQATDSGQGKGVVWAMGREGTKQATRGRRTVWSVQKTVCLRGQMGAACRGKRAIWPGGEGAAQRGEKRQAGGGHRCYEHSL